MIFDVNVHMCGANSISSGALVKLSDFEHKFAFIKIRKCRLSASVTAARSLSLSRVSTAYLRKLLTYTLQSLHGDYRTLRSSPRSNYQPSGQSILRLEQKRSMAITFCQ